MMAVALPTICAENPTSADLESDSLELLSDVCSDSEIELSVGSSQLSIDSVDSGMTISESSDSETDDELCQEEPSRVKVQCSAEE